MDGGTYIVAVELADGCVRSALVGLSVTPMPDGADTDNGTVEEKPLMLARLIVDVPVEPGVRLREVGAAEMLKSGAGLRSQTCSSLLKTGVEFGVGQEPLAGHNRKLSVAPFVELIDRLVASDCSEELASL